MTYGWCAGIAVVYLSVSFGLLFLNRKWDWIYGVIFDGAVNSVTPLLIDPIRMDDLESDPGLVCVIVALGPILIAIGIVLVIAAAIGGIVALILSSAFIVFPRWVINCVVRK